MNNLQGVVVLRQAEGHHQARRGLGFWAEGLVWNNLKLTGQASNMAGVVVYPPAPRHFLFNICTIGSECPFSLEEVFLKGLGSRLGYDKGLGRFRA